MRNRYALSTLTTLFLNIILSTTALADSANGAGKFIFDMKHYDDEPAATFYTEIKKDGSFAKDTDDFNALLNIPENVNIVFDKAKEGPNYLGSKKTITLDYDMFEITELLFHKNYPDQDQAAEFEYAVNVNRFFLYHELGHALIDVYHLPMVGDEETTADNLAAMFALEFTDKGWEIVTDAADFFDLLRKAREDDQLEDTYWDEHRMDSQRYYYLLCMAYGKYPEETKKELESYKDNDLNKFIEERGDRCAADYQDSLAKWKQLLDPHMKTSKDQ